MPTTHSMLPLVLALLVPACVSSGVRTSVHDADQALALATTRQPGEVHELPDAVSRIDLTEASSPSRPTEFIGLVDVPARSIDDPAARLALRERAVGLDADAVVSLAFRDAKLSGVAVRYHTLATAQRAYDVIGEVRSDDDEAHALDALCARARSLHADLLVNVGVDRDDVHDGHVRLRGTAVRYR